MILRLLTQESDLAVQRNRLQRPLHRPMAELLAGMLRRGAGSMVRTANSGSTPPPPTCASSSLKKSSPM